MALAFRSKSALRPILLLLMLCLFGACSKKDVGSSAGSGPLRGRPNPNLKTVYFDFDRYDIRATDTPTLEASAGWLKQYPKVKVIVEGHCDERGTNEYNMALGERRANSAKNYLVNLGVQEDRLVTVSYGEEKPADPAHDEGAWAKNRRADFLERK